MTPSPPQRRRLSLDEIFALAADRHRNGHPDAAAGLYRMLILFAPESTAVWTNLCSATTALGRTPEAIVAGSRAVRTKPASVKTCLILGHALSKHGDFRRAAAVLEWAAALAPASLPVLQALGMVRHGLGRFEDAASVYRRALVLEPGDPDTEHSLAHALLTMGAFKDGWSHYLARPSVRTVPAPYDRRRLPPDLTGQHLAVIGDQGLGDEVFFLRFVPTLTARGARVTYCAHPKIAGMVSRLPFLDRTVEAVGAIPTPVDRILSVGDLPHLLDHRSTATIPPPVALSPQPERTAALRRRLAALGPPPYVGVAWRAGVADLLFKQVPMPGLAAALKGLPLTVLSLQRQPAPGEVDAFAEALGAPVADLGDSNENLEEMLALLPLLDELVCVSNTNVHLRTALGRPSRVLVPFPPEFRWMAQGAGSPWFPGCTVYRQPPDLSWEEPLARLRGDLDRAGRSGCTAR
ncbi:MAG TPA: hypothetical protein VD978_25775 [Azospirillum sp.]|nr:hypothetical protein [Azospirillum sp.]